MCTNMTKLFMRKVAQEAHYTLQLYVMAWHALPTILCTMLLCVGVQAGCLDQKRLLGVNLSGAEFGHDRLPGLLNRDYVYPSRKDLAYFRGLNMNVVRVPFRWERLQKQIDTALDPTELAQLRQVVAWAAELDLCVLLDLHNFGAYHGHTLGSTGLPASALADIWLRLHREFDKPDRVAFGLMNEPMDGDCPANRACATPGWGQESVAGQQRALERGTRVGHKI
jgi:endoglucanase